VFWKFSSSPITIPVELHEKLARTCKPIEEVDSEVLCVRQVSREDDAFLDAAESMEDVSQERQGTDNTNLSDAIGYEAHWQWYR
jgi:hypothetical protein